MTTTTTAEYTYGPEGSTLTCANCARPIQTGELALITEDQHGDYLWAVCRDDVLNLAAHTHTTPHMTTDDRWPQIVYQWPRPQATDTQPEQATHMTNPDNYPTDYTDDDNPTIHAIQAEAVAKERTRITNALHSLTRPTTTSNTFYTEGWNDALERATLHANGDR